MFVVVFK